MLVESALGDSLLVTLLHVGQLPMAGKAAVPRGLCKLPSWQCLGPDLSNSLRKNWTSRETATVSIGYPQSLYPLLAWWAGCVEPNVSVLPGSKPRVCGLIKGKSTRRLVTRKHLSEASKMKDVTVSWDL